MQPCVKGDLKEASKSPTLRSLKTEEMHQHKGLACSLLSRSLAHPGTVNAFLKRVCVPRCWRLVTAPPPDPPPPPRPQSLLHTKSGFSGLSQHFRVIFLDKWSHVSWEWGSDSLGPHSCAFRLTDLCWGADPHLHRPATLTSSLGAPHNQHSHH